MNVNTDIRHKHQLNRLKTQRGVDTNRFNNSCLLHYCSCVFFIFHDFKSRLTYIIMFSLLGITFSIVAVAVVCVIIIILFIFIHSLKRRSEHVSSNNLDKPIIIEIPEHSSNITCE